MGGNHLLYDILALAQLQGKVPCSLCKLLSAAANATQMLIKIVTSPGFMGIRRGWGARFDEGMKNLQAVGE